MTNSLSRRRFLKNSITGGAVLALSAKTYSRVIGANERISIGQIGCGSRGVGAHMAGIHKHDKAQNVEYTAVADPWRIARENAATKVKEWYGTEARQFSSHRDLLALKDIDAVMIASCDHQHTTHLLAAAQAGKDIYCEKPLALDLEKLKAACDAVNKAEPVVQIGTQLRSFPTFAGCRKTYQTGILGTVGRIEQCRNGSQPYWYGYVKEVRKEDLDWEEFTMGRTDKTFDPGLYSGWYGHREFTDGPITNLGCHYIDLVHYITGATFPTSCVAMSGSFTWNDKYKFSCPDHVQAVWTYPEGFMVSYSTNFGNGSGNSFKIFGDVGVMDMVKWHAPILSAEGGSKNKGAIRGKQPVVEVPLPDHFLDWLQCMRTRKQCIAPIEAGFQHTVATMMAVQASDTGKRVIYEPKKRLFLEG